MAAIFFAVAAFSRRAAAQTAGKGPMGKSLAAIGLGLILAASGLGAEPRFEDRSAGLPPHIYAGGWEHFVGGGVAAFDCSGDGLPELFLAGGEAPAQLLGNGGDFGFTPLPLPGAPLTGVTGAYPLDLTGDGVLDLFVLRVGPNLILEGGPDCTFTPRPEALPEADRWSTAFTAWWAPGADRPTLAVGSYVDRADPEGPFGTCDVNVILTPDGDGWRDAPLVPAFCPLSMLAARDARDRPTLRISNDRHYYLHDGAEQMWDIAEARFLGPEDGWEGPQLWGMGIASRDVTGDGLPEVMLTSMGDQLLQIASADGTYSAAPFSQGTYAQRPHTGEDGRPSTGWHAEFGDVDNDGRADLFIAKGNVDQMPGLAMEDPNNLLMQQPDGTFLETAAAAGVASKTRSRGATLADLDGDGRLDLVVVNRRAAAELHRNVTEGTGRWLAVDLRQPGGNAFAVGALVTVRADGVAQVQEVTVGGGHAGGRAGPLHFGLGGAETTEVVVDWPDGTRSTHIPDALNRVLRITK